MKIPLLPFGVMIIMEELLPHQVEVGIFPTSGDISSNVVSIVSTSTSFSALKTDGSVVSWGQTFDAQHKKKIQII